MSTFSCNRILFVSSFILVVLLPAHGQGSVDARLLGLLRSDTTNTLISPFGIRSVLLMIYDGAEGVTRKQIAQVLQLSDEEHTGKLRVLLSGRGDLTKSTEYDSYSRQNLNDYLSIPFYSRNAQWFDDGMSLERSYTDKMRQEYDAGVYRTDFHNLDVALSSINGWVEQNTPGTFKVQRQELIGASFVIMNASMFKAKWRYPGTKNALHVTKDASGLSGKRWSPNSIVALSAA